jgi:nitrite reductase/ring-hydroxylating ferredoxin subunit
VTVAKAQEVPEDALLQVTVDDSDVVVANVDGEYRALGDVCTHADCSLADGWIEDGTVVCICHSSAFDLETGNVVTGPAEEAVSAYQIRVEDDEIQVAKPDA